MADLNIAIQLSGTSTSATSAIDAVTRSLQNLERQASAADRPTESVFSRLTTGLIQGAGQFAAGRVLDSIASGFDAIKAGAITLNSNLEQSRIAFTTMLGSGEKAQSFLDDLAKFAAKTPFEFPDLVTASKRLLAMGISAKDVVPTLTAVGNAAAAIGGGKEAIDRISLALGQMTAKGKVSAEEMMQLTEAGIPAWQMLADKLGVDVATAMDKVQKRMVDSATFMDAFRTGTAARYGDMMAQQAKTFEGAMSTIHDSVQMAIATGFKPLFDAISQAAQQRAEFLSSESVTEWATAFAAQLQRVIVLFQQFQGGLGRLGAMVGSVAQEIAAQLGAVFGPIAETVTHLFGDGGSGGSIGEQVAAFITSLPERIAGLPDAIAAQLRNLPTLTAGILNTFAQAWNSNIDTINGTVRTLQATWQSVINAVQNAWSGILQPALAAVLAKFGEVKDWVVGHWPDVQTFFGNVAAGIQEKWTTLIQPALTELYNAFERARNWVVAQWPNVQTTWETVAGALATFYNTQLQPMFQALGQAFETARNWVAQHWPDVGTFFSNVGGTLKSTWEATIQPMFQQLGGRFQTLKAWVVDQWPHVQDTFAEVATGIQNMWATTIYPALTDFIRTVGELKDTFIRALDIAGQMGAWQNLKQAWESLARDTWPIVQRMLADFLRDLGLAKGVATGEDGAYGLAKGITSVTRSLLEMTQALPNALNGLVTLGGVFNDLQYVINQAGLMWNKLFKGDLAGAAQHATNAQQGFANLQTRLGQLGGFLNAPPVTGGGTAPPFGAPISEGGGGIQFGPPGAPFTPPGGQQPPASGPTNPGSVVPGGPNAPWNTPAGVTVPPGFPNTEYSQYITAAAMARGIDPATALAVAMSEGGLTEAARLGDFSGPPWYSGKSWWAFQLHYGGAGTPYAAWGTAAGMGNDFTARTGYQPGDPNAWQAAATFALDHARNYGWGAWYGAAARGITGFYGIQGHDMGALFTQPMLAMELRTGRWHTIAENGPERLLSREETAGYGGRQGVTIQQTIYHNGPTDGDLDARIGQSIKRALWGAGFR